MTPLLVASLCGNKKTIKELLKAGATLVDEDLPADSLADHEQFVKMLNREFPSSAHVEQSSLQVPSTAAKSHLLAKKRATSPGNYSLPRKCGISE